jgi:formyl-CoA transferase
MYASVAVCAALAHRAETGKGQHLDLALLDSSVAILANQGANFLATGKVPKGIGNAHPNIVPYQPFRTADGDVIVACGNDGQFRKFCEVAGCAHLPDDPRFAANGKRVENRVELTAILSGIMAKRPTRDWVEALEAAGVPNGPINAIDRVFQEPQAIARGLRIELAHPTAGKVSLVRSPMRFSGTPVEHELPPPTLGQHTEEILRGILKLGDTEISRLRAEGVI